MRRTGLAFLLAILLLSVTICGTSDGASPALDKAQITALLEKKPVCQLVDARSEKQRSKNPVKGALIYGKNMDIKSGCTVLVIADSDRRAQEVAGKLAASGKCAAYAVKGGYKTWMLVAGEGSEAGKAEPGRSFIIPKNTCESGEAIQEFKK